MRCVPYFSQTPERKEHKGSLLGRGEMDRRLLKIAAQVRPRLV